MTSASPATLPKVYIFSGNDPVGKESARARALRSIRTLHRGAMVNYFDATAQPFTDFAESMLMPTLFADIRIFSITRAETLSEKELSLLSTIITTPPEDIFVVIDIGETASKKRSKSDPAQQLQVQKRNADTSGTYFCRTFEKPPDYKVAAWLVDTTPELINRQIGLKDAELLVDLAGYDIAILHSELQKIDLHLEAGEPVSADAIRHIVGSSREMTAFELASACGSKNAIRMIEVLHSLFTTTVSVPMLVGVLYRHYIALFRIRHYLASNAADNKLLTKSGGSFQAKNDAAFRTGCAAGLLRKGEERKVYPVMITSGIVAQAQKYSDEALKTIVSWLLDFDVAVKTGQVSGSLCDMELLCYRLLRATGLAGSGCDA